MTINLSYGLLSRKKRAKKRHVQEIRIMLVCTPERSRPCFCTAPSRSRLGNAWPILGRRRVQLCSGLPDVSPLDGSQEHAGIT